MGFQTSKHIAFTQINLTHMKNISFYELNIWNEKLENACIRLLHLIFNSPLLDLWPWASVCACTLGFAVGPVSALTSEHIFVWASLATMMNQVLELGVTFCGVYIFVNSVWFGKNFQTKQNFFGPLTSEAFYSPQKRRFCHFKGGFINSEF